MIRTQLMAKLREPLHLRLSWKQLAWIAGCVVPWVLTISIATAINTFQNAQQQITLNERSKAIEELSIVKTDIGWLKKSNRRIEQRIFGNSVIPQDREQDEEEAE